MSNEIRFQAQASVTLGGGLTVSGGRVRQADIITDGQGSGVVQNIGTAAEALNVGDIAPRLLYIENRGDLAATPVTHTVQLGLESTVATPFAELLPGDANVFSLPAGVTVYGKAVGGAVDVYFIVAERSVA